MAKIFSIAFILLFLSIAPPAHFPSNYITEVPQGTNLRTLSLKLKNENIIRSAWGFQISAKLLGGERQMKAGQYFMERPQSAITLAWRILHGDHQIKTVKLTIPEGFTVKKISSLFDDKFIFFDNAAFLAMAPEGYLFPDTYFIPVTATATSTIKLMRDNFVRKIFPMMPEVELSGKTLEEIITMASLLEAEVKTKEEREIVSDILWKRLKLGMPLQVDSDMGTYEFQGLPERPINNPGIVSILAALHPTTTPYLYFLTDKDGKMHTARTFDEHVANKQKYLQ